MIDAAIARILITSDPPRMEEAEKLLTDAVVADERNGMRWFLAQDYALLSELYRWKENRSGARQYLNRAIEIMRECGADGWVEKYKTQLAELPKAESPAL